MHYDLSNLNYFFKFSQNSGIDCIFKVGYGSIMVDFDFLNNLKTLKRNLNY